eukprot:3722788-Pleurochrysis_carterae.AAC.1
MEHDPEAQSSEPSNAGPSNTILPEADDVSSADEQMSSGSDVSAASDRTHIGEVTSDSFD